MMYIDIKQFVSTDQPIASLKHQKAASGKTVKAGLQKIAPPFTWPLLFCCAAIFVIAVLWDQRPNNTFNEPLFCVGQMQVCDEERVALLLRDSEAGGGMNIACQRVMQ